MDKLVFNEGGQPLYLDDLQTLQSQSLDLVYGLIRGLCGGLNYGGTEVIWILKPQFKGGYSDLGYLFHPKYGVIVTPGGQTHTEGEDKLYVKLTITPGDYRTLDNGQSAACKSTITATYVTEEGENTYDVDETYDMITCLKNQISNS